MTAKNLEEVPIHAEVSDIISFVSRVFYSREYIVYIRELVTNAFDAITIRKKKTQNGYTGQVNICYDPEQGHVVVSDNGWGLDENAIRNNLLKILSGVRRNPTAKEILEDEFYEIIGGFGVGLMSCFRVANEVEIETKRENCVACKVILQEEMDPETAYREHYRAFLSPSTRAEVGTEVTVKLARMDEKKHDNVERTDSADLIRDALYYYIKHPPNGITVTANITEDPEEVLPSPFLGQDTGIYQEIDRDGVFGYLGVGSSLEPQLRVSQNGILVKENYLDLLPEGSVALCGEINIAVSTLAQLKPSREEYIEDEHFQKLKAILKTATKRLNDALETAAPNMVLDAAEKNEYSPDAIALLKMYQNNPLQKNIIRLKVVNAVKFKNITSGTHALLRDIEKAAKSKNQQDIYIYTVDRNTVHKVCTVDGFDLFSSNTNDKLIVDLLKQKEATVVELLAINDDGKRINFKDIVADYFSARAFKVVDLSALVDMTQMSWLLGRVDTEKKLTEFGLVIPEGDGRLQRLLPNVKTIHIEDGQKMYRMGRQTWVNTANKDIIKLLDRVLKNDKKSTQWREMRRYVQIMTANFQNAMQEIWSGINGGA